MTEEAKKEVEEKTTDQDASPDEKKDQVAVEDTTQNNEQSEEQESKKEDDWSPPTKEEFEKLQKKASDFDKSVELKRLAKIAAKQKDEGADPNSDEVVQLKEQIETLTQEVANIKIGKTNNQLTEVYREWIKENPWADDDEKFSAISQNFNPEGAESKEQLLARLSKAASDTYPEEYIKHVENRVRGKVLAEKDQINAGNMGGGSSVVKNDEPKEVTKEDQRIADKFFGGDIERYLKVKNK